LATTTKIVLIMEYDGKHYHGFQLQATLPTIQWEVEKALWGLTGERIRVMAASRTDAGVHAKGQVVSFRTRSPLPPQTFVNGLNYYLPRDIAIKAAYRIGDSFNVRRDAISREYNYYILNSLTRSPIREGFVYRVGGHLDIEAMNQACQALIGEHDFSSFASSTGVETKSTVRRVYQVGTLIRVGLGRMRVDEFCSIIETKKLGLVGPTAPAHGLCLMQVNYPYPFEEEI